MSGLRIMLSLTLALVSLGAATTASAPAEDLSTPRAALVSMYKAMRAGDVAGVHECLIFEDPREAELFDLNFAQVAAPLKLQRALAGRFGAASVRPLADGTLEKNIDASLDEIRTADIEISGDSAVLDEKKVSTNPNAENELSGVTLRCANGKWRVVASTLSDSGGDVSPAQLQLIRKMSSTVSTACAHILARLQNNEFATPQAAYAAYQAELQADAKK